MGKTGEAARRPPKCRARHGALLFSCVPCESGRHVPLPGRQDVIYDGGEDVAAVLAELIEDDADGVEHVGLTLVPRAGDLGDRGTEVSGEAGVEVELEGRGETGEAGAFADDDQRIFRRL